MVSEGAPEGPFVKPEKSVDMKAHEQSGDPMISVPKGVLRLATLKLLSDSSMSGTDLSRHIARVTNGDWKPGPGSVYLILSELLREGMITELPKRGGNVRRYIVSGKGKSELARMSKEAEADVSRQVRLLSIYAAFAGKDDIGKKLSKL